MKPIILKTGQTIPSLKRSGEDFEHWIAKAARIPLHRFHIIDCHASDPYPTSADAVIVTGSQFAVHDREKWSEEAATWLTGVLRDRVPVLGICYGHQLIAHALGGQSARNPSGREIGVVEVDLHRDDPLFEGLPKRIPVIETHLDAVLEPPENSFHLGGSAKTQFQALGYDNHCRTVQWHPEFTQDIIRAYITERASEIDSESGIGHSESLLRDLKPTETGPVIMQNFFAHFANGRTISGRS